jgi:hypothetical protein
MHYETKLSRGSEGWSAITRTPLGNDGKRILRIRTAKSQTSRTLVSAATVWHVGALGETHAMGFGGPTGDFTAHQAALNRVPQVLSAIDKHYEDQAAKAAQDAATRREQTAVQAAHQAVKTATPGVQFAPAR